MENRHRKMSNVAHLVNLAISAYVLINLAVLDVAAMPATTSAPTTHIVSYVQQRSAKAKSNEFREFDFESINANASVSNQQQPTRPTPIQQLYGRLVQRLDMNLNNSLPAAGGSAKLQTPPHSSTDDQLSSQQNTLDNADDVFGNNTQHESGPAMTASGGGDRDAGAWNRMKQSIPVLEPVKHLLNTVRDGAFNMTAHVVRQHHQLVSSVRGANGAGGMAHQNESSAIETEEDRETANDSTEFKLLDFLGSFVGMIWSFIANIQKAFAASSGNASAAASSTSSSSGQ